MVHQMKLADFDSKSTCRRHFMSDIGTYWKGWQVNPLIADFQLPFCHLSGLQCVDM